MQDLTPLVPPLVHAVGSCLLWTIYALSTGDHHLVSEQLGEST